MSWSIYQVSQAQTVVSFSKNQKEPNKVGISLTEKMISLVKDGVCFNEAYAELKSMHEEYKEKKVRGIDSVSINCHNDYSIEREQTHQSIYLSYKLNGTFATYTEYSSLKK